MKHVQPYQEFINESQSEHRELTRQEFNNLTIQPTGKRNNYRWIPLTGDEKASLYSLYNYMDKNRVGRYNPESVPGEDLRFIIIMNWGESAYPRVQIGKLSPVMWTVNTSDDVQGEMYLETTYNTFKSLEGVIGFVADKYGPPIEWIKIK